MELPFSPGFFRRLQSLRIQTRKTFLGSRQGSHVSSRRGHGIEFSDYRPYTQNDDFRHIDWGVYGRTERLYVKLFREEQDLQVVFFLDVSLSMSFPPSKFEIANRLALALAYVALADGDSVAISPLGKMRSPNYRGQGSLLRLNSFLEKSKADSNLNFPKTILQSAAQHKGSYKCFLISDLLFTLEEFIEGISTLINKNHDISIIQLLSPQELELSEEVCHGNLIDSETGEELEISLGVDGKKQYLDKIESHLKNVRDYSHSRGIAHVVARTDIDLENFVLKRLPTLGLLG